MKVIFISILFSLVALASDATIEVIKQSQRMPSLAVEDSTDSYDKSLNKKFFKAIVSDLKVLSIFNVSNTYVKNDFDDDVDVINMKKDIVIKYSLEDNDGSTNVNLKIIRGKKAIFQKRYKINRTSLYIFVAHSMAYDINKVFGSNDVAWMKRKVVISRLVGRGESEIVLTDYTLTYQHVVVRGGLNVFPKFLNNKQNEIVYTNLSGLRPTLFKLDTLSGKSQKLLTSDGLLICSDISDDGKEALLSMAPNGQSDIYKYNFYTKKLKRITKYKGIDVNAQFMDGNTIAFVSNRLGYPNVFQKNLDNNEVDQMVYYGKSNSACSAHNEYLVYKARESKNAFSANTFNLHLISTKSDFVRRLTASGVNDFPRFSKDGRAVLFIKNYKNQSAIGVIRLEYNKNYLFPLNIGKIQSMDW